MRVPDLSLYKDADYDEVVALIMAEEIDPPSYREELLNGLALVARDERDPDARVVGFIWALAAEGNPVAYVDYFSVAKDLRGTNTGLWLLGTLVVMLREKGIKKLLANIPKGMGAYIRMIRRKGGQDKGLHHLVEMELGENNGKDDRDHAEAEFQE